MGPDPPYIPAKFGDDTFKLEKVLDKKNQKVNDNHNNHTITKEHPHAMGDVLITISIIIVDYMYSSS